MFFVFNSHFLTITGLGAGFDKIIDESTSYGVAAFLLISGWYLGKTFSNCEAMTAWFRRVVRLLPKATFIGVLTISTLTGLQIDSVGITHSSTTETLFSGLSPLWFQFNPGHYWTLSAEWYSLIFLTLISITRNSLGKAIWVGLAVIWSATMHIWFGILLAIPLFGALAYFCNHKFSISNHISEYRILVWMPRGLFLVSLFYVPHMDYAQSYFGSTYFNLKSHFTVMSTAILIISFNQINKIKMSKLISRITNSLSSVVYEFYLVHFLVVVLVNHYLAGAVQGIATYILALILSYGAAKLTNILFLLNWLPLLNVLRIQKLSD